MDESVSGKLGRAGEGKIGRAMSLDDQIAALKHKQVEEIKPIEKTEIKEGVLESSAKRSAGVKKKPIESRNDPPPIMPGSFETLPSTTIKNRVEDLKAQGKTFGGAEGEAQEREAADKANKEDTSGNTIIK